MSVQEAAVSLLQHRSTAELLQPGSGHRHAADPDSSVAGIRRSVQNTITIAQPKRRFHERDLLESARPRWQPDGYNSPRLLRELTSGHRRGPGEGTGGGGSEPSANSPSGQECRGGSGQTNLRSDPKEEDRSIGWSWQASPVSTAQSIREWRTPAARPPTRRAIWRLYTQLLRWLAVVGDGYPVVPPTIPVRPLAGRCLTRLGPVSKSAKCRIARRRKRCPCLSLKGAPHDQCHQRRPQRRCCDRCRGRLGPLGSPRPAPPPLSSRRRARLPTISSPVSSGR